MIRGRQFASALLNVVGRDIAIGYAVFLALALFAGLVSDTGFVDARVTLADLLSGDSMRALQGGGSARGALLALLATATIGLPCLWKHRLAPLAFTVPLLVTAGAFWPLYRQHRQQQEAFEAMGELSRTMGPLADQMAVEAGGPLANLGIGAWLLFATVIFLALRGAMRAFARG